MMVKNKRLAGIILTATLLLLVPFLTMQFTTEVNWTPFDFAVAAALLFGTGFVCELVMRKVKNKRHRIALCATVLGTLVLIWLELAVGIFGTTMAGS